MRDYFESIHRCLLRRDRHEARRLLSHAYRQALPARVRGWLADLALGRAVPTPARPLRLVRELQALMVDETPAAAPGDDAQLELPLRPAAWSRPVNLTIARAGRPAPAHGDETASGRGSDGPWFHGEPLRRRARAGD